MTAVGLLGVGLVAAVADAFDPAVRAHAGEVDADVFELGAAGHAEALGDVGGREGGCGVAAEDPEDVVLERRMRGRRHRAVDDRRDALHARGDLRVNLRPLGVDLREARAEFLQLIAVIYHGLYGITHARDRIMSVLLSVLTI